MNLTEAEEKNDKSVALTQIKKSLPNLFLLSMILSRDLYLNVTPRQSDSDLFHYEVTTSNE